MGEVKVELKRVKEGNTREWEEGEGGGRGGMGSGKRVGGNRMVGKGG